MRPGKARIGTGPSASIAQGGFTLMAVLAALFILALATYGVVAKVSQRAQREREAELLRVGQAYVDAISRYYEQSPGNVKRWPAQLEDLVDDKRFVVIRRHIRKLYADPVAKSQDWGLVLSGEGGIAGVYSLSGLAPIRTAAIDLGTLQLPVANRYADWQFVYRLPASAAAPVKR